MNHHHTKAAAYFVDLQGLPTALAPFYASLIPDDCDDPDTFLGAALYAPSHRDLVPWLGNAEQLTLRLAAFATRPVDDLKYHLNPDWYEELIATALAKLVGCVPYLIDADDIPEYVYRSVRRAVSARLDELKSEPTIPFGRRELTHKHSVAELYGMFYAAVRDGLERRVLELRWRYDGGVRLGPSMYAEDIAAELGIPCGLVVDQLELLQRRFLRIVNDIRRSRNNRNLRALRPIPIHRIFKPQEAAA